MRGFGVLGCYAVFCGHLIRSMAGRRSHISDKKSVSTHPSLANARFGGTVDSQFIRRLPVPDLVVRLLSPEISAAAF